MNFNEFHSEGEDFFQIFLMEFILLLDVEVRDEFRRRRRFVAVRVFEFGSFRAVLFWLDDPPFTGKE